MRANFFNAVKNLLPSSSAWNLTQEKNVRKLFEAIAVLPEDLRREIERVYMDFFPDSTRCIDRWEEVFTVLSANMDIEQRRSFLALLWGMNHGGQSLYFIRSVLENVFPGIVVEENTPCANPRESNIAYFAVCDNEIMVCDGEKAVCDYREGDESFVPTILRNGTAGPYSIPNDERYWEFCFYVCKNIVRNSRNEILYVEKLQIPRIYKNYIEYFILRIKPVHTVAVLAVEWTEE